MQDKWHELLFAVRRSVRYHMKRVAFFDKTHKAITLLCLVAGSATMASVLASGPAWVTTTLAVMVAFFSALDLVVGTASKARAHTDLARDFLALEKELLACKGDNEQEIKDLWQRRLDIETGEAPILQVLDTICHNELCRALGCYEPEHIKSIAWYQRAFANICDILPHRLGA